MRRLVTLVILSRNTVYSSPVTTDHSHSRKLGHLVLIYIRSSTATFKTLIDNARVHTLNIWIRTAWTSRPIQYMTVEKKNLQSRHFADCTKPELKLTPHKNDGCEFQIDVHSTTDTEPGRWTRLVMCRNTFTFYRFAYAAVALPKLRTCIREKCAFSPLSHANYSRLKIKDR